MQGLVQEAEELKTRYDKILRENQKVLEAKDLEKDEVSLHTLQRNLFLHKIVMQMF